jgi:hypothetical protein
MFYQTGQYTALHQLGLIKEADLKQMLLRKAQRPMEVLRSRLQQTSQELLKNPTIKEHVLPITHATGQAIGAPSVRSLAQGAMTPAKTSRKFLEALKKNRADPWYKGQ